MSWSDLVDTKSLTELERLSLLEEISDPFSIRNLDRLGVRPGWRCLEVGAGAGSIARRLGELTGPGNVVATDLSTKFLDPLADLGIEVLLQDVTTDDPPGEFDLIHTRYVLDHLPDRDDVLKRMASWLRPGGWLLVEAGTTAPELSSNPVVRRATEALNAVMSQSVGTHTTWARSLPLPLEAAGLSDCRAEGYILPAQGGSSMARWFSATYKLIEERALDSGLITRAELDAAYATLDSPSFVDYTWLVVAGWGRRV
ncbi:MAG TPA: methyltransferase [Actinophytocola sp.]|uniref:methyltransferase n=1 Tax=Actinophytocola sp. TaxID=1872138 RepID=UPI002DDD1CEA|nr:methyltransferase [Actinophytocola sp.]HEV2778844.1 methyltransferase [Actinophytocola sp.]